MRCDRACTIAKMLALAAVILAACAAAALAHIGIDVVGDYVLPHDAYDDVTHGSRATTAAFAAAVSLATIVFALCSAVADVRKSRGRVRAALESGVNRSSWRFIGSVLITTFVVLLAMETLDTFLQYGRIDNFSDLLGGSIPLAFAVTVPIAIVVAWTIRFFLGTLLRSCHALVAAVHSFVRRALLRRTLGILGRDRLRVATLACRPCIMSLKGSRRGPPMPLECRHITA
jgi:hypothetical protein